MFGSRRRFVRRGAVALALLAALAGAVPARESKPPQTAKAAAPAPTETLNQVLSRFDRIQGQIRTLSADFVQTTRSPLLRDPVVAKGRFYLTKPDSVLWEYSAPELMRFAVADGKYTGYFPERKKAEKRDIRRWSEQLFRFFGVGQGSKELGKFYEIALGAPGQAHEGAYLLVLSPKKRRVRKRFDEVRLWVDTTSLLPVRIEYVGKDGNEREIRLLNIQFNPDLAAGLYDVAIPDGIPISNGFSGLDVSARAH
jgi:outer membrane lipoprotein-sorting protein